MLATVAETPPTVTVDLMEILLAIPGQMLLLGCVNMGVSFMKAARQCRDLLCKNHCVIEVSGS